ncbi:MAG: DUF2062 domain-containing protein [Alphaproteobacteria bacterium]|jgi:uncharacterized protein (DUF2062 family)
MVFGRRVKPSYGERVRGFIWPRSGLKRSSRYIVKRVSRLNATPHAIAAGFAAGAAASFTPFLGFHFLLGFAIAWMVRGSFVAAAFGTVVGNPLTFPLIFAATWETGHWMLGLVQPTRPHLANAAAHGQAVIEQGFFSSGLDTLWPVVKTMTVGALPLGIVAFCIFYVLTRSLVSAFKRTRKARQAHRRAARAAVVRSTKEKAPRGLIADA